MMAKRQLLEITPPTDLDDAFSGNPPVLSSKHSPPPNCQSVSDSITPDDLLTTLLFDAVEPSHGPETCTGSPSAHKSSGRISLPPDES